MFTGSRVWPIGIAWPALIVCVEVPFSSSRYFSPIADTDWTIARVSAGSGSTLFSSFRLAIAVMRPVCGILVGA